MKFGKTVDLVREAPKEYSPFSVNVLVVLAFLSFFIFISTNIIAGIHSNQDDIGGEKQSDNDKEATSRENPHYQAPEDPESRQVRIGLYENKPKVYTDNTGAVSGIFVEILEEIARREKWQVTYIPCVWTEGLIALGNGSIDLMPDVAFSPDREEQFDFHEEEVITSWSAVYANDKPVMSKISDLAGKRIAVIKDSIHHIYLERLVNGLGFKVIFIFADSFEDAFLIAAKGKADAVVTNHLFGDSFHQEYGLKKTPIVFNPVSLYFATASGSNHDLLAAIDKNLLSMKSQPGSVYYKAVVSWMEETPRTIVPRYYIWIFLIISGLLILAFMFVVMLRWQVKAGTQKLAQANRLLVNSEKKFRDLFHQHSAVKLLINPNNGTIVEANKAAEHFYGWTGKQLRQMRIQDIDTLPAEEIKAVGQKSKTGKLVHSEFRHKLSDGSVRNVAVFCSSIEIEGKSLVHTIIHDITVQSRLEEQLRQAQKMEAVGRLAGGVAHDYNNMLSVILGYTELALKKTDPSEPLHDDLTAVFDAARRSSEITRQLLAFARKQSVVPKALDLNKTVEGMLKMLQRLIGENIQLDWLPGSGLWFVKIDPVQVDQIMVNLCLNSRDSIADIGNISIETDNVILDQTFGFEDAGFVPGEFVLLSVGDDGCGMDKEILSHLFEPFFTTKGVGKGTGLGLATVYGIVKQNNGFIKAESEPGNGASIKIYLSRNKDNLDKAVDEKAKKTLKSCTETVLLVEDEQTIRRMCRRMLEHIGYHVLEADSPGEALRVAREQTSGFDLLLTDVVMPGMNGSDLADQLTELYPGFGILFMSGYSSDVISQRGVMDKGVHFIQKPFFQKELASKVRGVLEEL
jgi:PAS domain S-box-containing protein